MKGRLLRRLVQAASLALFIYLLLHLTGSASDVSPLADLYLRLDPLTALATPLAARDFIPGLWPGLLVLLSALLAGRFFCGYICPFGATLSLAGWLKSRLRPAGGPRPSSSPGLSKIKYLLLAALLAAALFGSNLFFWLAPIPLATRFYALLLYPLSLAAGEGGLNLLRPLLAGLDGDLAYAALSPRGFDGLWYLLIFFGLVFGLEMIRPRFWCRCLCPAGALLGVLSHRPLWRRRVSRACTGCGRCLKACPGGAIEADGRSSRSRECLACQSCRNVCPVGAVSFAVSGAGGRAAGPSLSRRALLGSLAAAAALGALPSLPFSENADGTAAETPVRPPGSLPESDFLSRCLRCAECLQACPTNALGLAGLSAGFEKILTPQLTARRGPCQPDCRRCTQVCPSGAIRPLSLPEKKAAKIGTARVVTENCLAWAEDRSCVVCQEVCPYAAISLIRPDGRTASVPLVAFEKCYGCGYCEYHCPVRPPAIVVEARGALRLKEGDYAAAAEKAGLHLDPDRRETEEEPADQLPPGFINLD